MLGMFLEGISRVNHFKFFSSFPSSVKQDGLGSTGMILQEPVYQPLINSIAEDRRTKYNQALSHR